MRALKVPAGALARSFAKLVSSKRGVRQHTLTALLPTVRTRYSLYFRTRPALEQVQPLNWSVLQKEALVHCYESETATLREIKDSVLASIGDDESKLCSYCLLRGIDHVDHFLPIAHYPEFGTLRINLVWACGKCNGRKGDVHGVTPRNVLNPYFDRVPSDTALLYCNATVSNGRLAFSFFVPPQVAGIQQTLVDTARRHCDFFGLAKSYQLEASALIAGWMRELSARFPTGLDAQQLSQEVAFQTARWPQDMPVNHWTVATWFALEHCQGLHGYVNEFIANNPPPPMRQAPARHANLLNWF